jgi:hypothetical protein
MAFILFSAFTKRTLVIHSQNAAGINISIVFGNNICYVHEQRCNSNPSLFIRTFTETALHIL